eukprot:jgi/Mesvir1/13156/Mv06124-RA.2
MEDAHNREIGEVLSHFNVDPNRGLSDAEVDKQRAVFGRNEIRSEQGTPFWRLVLKQFDDLLVRILIAAAIVSFLLTICDGEADSSGFVEPLVIIAILLANATVGVITESNAEKAIEELKAYEADNAVVLRNGRLSIVPAAELVPGDIVEVSVGGKIPADLRTVAILSSQLRVDQSILTGESNTVLKRLEATNIPKAVYQDKDCILFSGTTVTVGRARTVVVGIGSKTAMGKIRDAMAEPNAEMTPLKKKLDEFGTFLSKVIAVVCVLVWVVNIGHFRDPHHGGMIRGAIYYFKIAVALAVAAIPEGLPAVVTTCLALGTKKMAKLNAIVRTLPSVETLGCTTVICSDKTGTLTTNRMSVCKVCVVSNKSPSSGTADASMTEYHVTGTSFAPEGQLFLCPPEGGSGSGTTNNDTKHNNTTTGGGSSNRRVLVERPADMPSLSHVAMCGALCNNSHVHYNADTGTHEAIGEATEAALRVLTEKIGLPGFDAMPGALQPLSTQDRSCYCNMHWEEQFSKIQTLDFSRDRKCMTVLCARRNQHYLFSKGAPEAILAHCTHVLLNDDGAAVPLTAEIKVDISRKVAQYGGEVLRCMALAMRPVAETMQTLSPADEAGMTFVGMVAMRDPPRPEVKGAVEACRAAGIRVIVVTGDNKATAEAVCRIVGIMDPLDAGGSHSRLSLTGAEFDQLPPMEQMEASGTLTVFSRVEPSHKSLLVDILRAQGGVVAMTGDGVNDAPALKKADIGVAMGTGTAVAKSVSNMVLADDNFATIVAAVAEGRAIYNNTKQFIRYMVSSNIGEVVCIFVAAALGMPETLIPVQLLWVNLVTDGLPATALGFNKPDKDIMSTRPRKVDEAIVNGWLFFRYVVIGVYVGCATVGGFAWWYLYYEGGPRMSWQELIAFEDCVEGAHRFSCAAFADRHPSTIGMSVLVTVEMFNAMNAVSENQSLLTLPPWSNPWLMAAIFFSFALHFLIIYVPFLAAAFSVSDTLRIGNERIICL